MMRAMQDPIAAARAWLRFQRMRARDLTRRRRWRLRRGEHSVSIASLASPLRYDIVVRSDFLAALRERLDAPLASQCEWARATSYWAWFRDVRWRRASKRFRASYSDIDAAFDARVASAIALSRSFAARGFDPRFPVSLKSADRMLPTETGKRVEFELVAGGGCHRIALLWLAGARELQPHMYVVQHYDELEPYDNTHLLRELLAGRPAEYVRFVASAYTTERVDDANRLMAWVAEHAPERAQNLKTILSADGVVPSAFGEERR